MKEIVVLHLIPSLSSGGAERQLVDVVCNTSRDLVRHVVCCWSNPDFFAPQIESSGSRVFDLSINGNHPWFAVAGKVDPILKEVKPDIVHSWLYDADIASRLVKMRNRRVPLITSLQSPHYEPETIRAANLSKVKVGALRWIDRITARMADPYFVACSKFVAASAEEWLGIDRTRMTVIYNSVDPRTLKSEDPDKVRSELGIERGEFVYLSVGRLDGGKGFSFLIDAFEKVIRSVPAAKLVIVGAGPDREALQTQIDSLRMRDKVILAGRRGDVGTCLEMADTFVFPTFFEGLPLALIEAMTKGLACIASDIPVLREVIDEGRSGCLIKPGSVDDWAQTMISLQSDREERTRLGAAAKEKVRSKFYSDVLMPQWEDLYGRISKPAGN